MKNFILIVLLIASVISNAQVAPKANVSDHVKHKLTKALIPGKLNTEILLPGLSPGHFPSARMPDVQVVDSIYHWTWDTASGDWQNFYRINDLTYNDANLPKTYTEQYWDGVKWIDGTRYVVTYDANNNQTLELEQFWDGGFWENSYRTVSTYDNANNLLTENNQFWDGNSWTDDRLLTYTYDANNNLLTGTIQHYETDEWVNQIRYTYAYDDDNNLVSYLAESWDETEWLNTNQSFSTYDANGNMISIVYQNWDLGGWLDILRYMITYDGNNNRTSQTVQYWIINEWVNYALFNYIYENGLVTEQFVDTWNGFEWIDYDYYTYEYDANGNNTYYVRRVWNGNAWLNAEEGSFSYDDDSNQIYEVYKVYTAAGDAIAYGDSFHYYFHVITATQPLADENDDILIYPNPGNGKVTINSIIPVTNMEVYNLQGQIIFTDVRHSGLEIKQADLSQVGQGIYFAKITCEGKSYSRVIVVQE